MGKWKTALMMIGIPMLMCYEKWWFIPFPELGNLFVYAASILSLWSAVQYSMSMIQKLKQSRAERKKSRRIKGESHEA